MNIGNKLKLLYFALNMKVGIIYKGHNKYWNYMRVISYYACGIQILKQLGSVLLSVDSIKYFAFKNVI
jgi:hypothetical protein